MNAAERIGAPLTLAAAGVAAGFLSFYPTVYRGVSELGQIAGVGMLIAYVAAITVLPALLSIFKPPGEPAEVGYRALAPVDRFLERHRIAVIGGTVLVALAGVPLLFHLTFDFNPMNLRSPKVESVATFLDLRSDPNVGANAINVLLPDDRNVAKTADDLRKIPEVEKVWTIADFVPADQDRKLPLIKTLARSLRPALEVEEAAAPTEEQTLSALKSTTDTLNKLAAEASGPGADAAKRLASSLTNLSKADQAKRDAVEAAFIVPLKSALDDLRNYLQAAPVTLQNLPDELKRQWISADGETRVQAFPKGDPNDNDTVRQFASAVLAHFPEAVGTPISILESGDIVVHTFYQAGTFALIAIAILLWIVLRRIGDVLLTLVPLLLAGLITLEICVLIGMPLNFANIIALPLLLGVGVAFKIYYIMAWRAGQTGLLQSSLTRAVIWSALTTATAFGSLWLSSHPGTSSMGKLMALSLLCTMCAAVLFQPALMGKPREKQVES
jgi:hopanoid biosynthesis associated RND transporter like protein HpnN